MAINFDDQSTGISYQQYPKDPQAREQIQILDNKVDELEQKTVSKQAIIDIESKVRQSDLDKENFKIAVTKELTDVKTVVEGIDGGNVEKIAEIEEAVNLKANKDVVDSLLNQIEGSVKQINGRTPDGNGNVIIDVNTEGLATIEEVTTKTDKLAELVFTKAEKADVEILTTQVANKASAQSVTQLTSQLAETVDEVNAVSQLPMQNKQVKPMILLIDDDGSTDFLTKLKPVYDANGIKGSIAVNTSKIGTSGFMTLEQLKTLQSEGFEILNHGKAHLSMDSRANDAERYEEVVTAQNYLKENGFKSWEHFVLGNGTSVNKKPESFAFLKKYVKSAVNTGPLVGSATAVNNAPIEQFSIHRQHTPDRTLAQCTAEIDKGIASNGLIVFFTHAQQAVLTPEKITEFDQLIKYGKSKNVPFVTLSEALETFGNIVDTGTGASGLKVSKTGITNIKEANMTFIEYLSSADFNNSITTFPSNTITRAVVSSSQATNSPTPGTSGILVTTKNSYQSGYNFQEWFPNNSDRVYKRRATSNGGWEAWKTFVPIEELNAGSIIIGVGLGVGTKLITDYTLNAITIEACSTANNPGLPESKGGTMKTYRISDQHVFCSREFKVTNGKTYTQASKADGTWYGWIDAMGTIV